MIPTHKLIVSLTALTAFAFSVELHAVDCPDPYECIKNTCGSDCQSSGGGIIALQRGEVVVGEDDPCRACRKLCFKAYYDCLFGSIDFGALGLVAIETEPSTPPDRSILVLTEGTVSSGDTNADRTVDLSDAMTIIQFLFLGGEAPAPIVVGGFDRLTSPPAVSNDRTLLHLDGNAILSTGDCNADGRLDVSDALHLLNNLFGTGAPPVQIVVGEREVGPGPGRVRPLPGEVVEILEPVR